MPIVTHQVIESVYLTLDFFPPYSDRVLATYDTAEEAQAHLASLPAPTNPDVTLLVREKHTPTQAEIEERAAEQARYEAEVEATTIRRGKTVEVVKGRKVPVGTVGEVFWIGDKGWGERVGFNDAEGNTHWTAASNCRVVALQDA